MISNKNAKRSLTTMLVLAASLSTMLAQAGTPHPDESWQGWNRYVSETKAMPATRSYANSGTDQHPDESWQGWNNYVAESDGMKKNMEASDAGYKHPDEDWSKWNVYLQQSAQGS